MDENLLLLIRAVVKVRAKLIALLLGLSFAFAFHTVRSAQPTFRADIKIYLRQSESSPLSVLGLESYQNKDIIASQAELIETYPIYQRVLPLLPQSKEAVKASPSIFERIAEGLQSLLFTHDVLKESEDYQNRHFKYFQALISTYYDGEGNHFTISAHHSNPRTAAELAKKAANALIDLNIEISSKTISSVAELLNRRVQESDKRLGQSTREITDFARKYKISSGRGDLSNKYTRYYELENQVNQRTAEIKQFESTLEYNKKRAQELLEKTKESLLQSNYNKVQGLVSQIQRLEFNLLQMQNNGSKKTEYLERRLTQLKRDLSKELETNNGSRGSEDIQASLGELTRKIASDELSLKTAQFALQNALTSKKKYETEIESIPELEAQRSALMLRHNQLLRVHELLTERYFKALSSSEVTYSKLYLIDDPALNSNLLGMDKVRRLCTLMGISIILVIGSLVIYDMMTRTVFTTEQLSRLENTEYLGAIDHIGRLKSKNLVKLFEADIHIARIAHTINRTLQKQAPQRLSNVISFCSVNQKSGKSVSCLAIAACLSRTNGPVLVLDFDFRAFNRSVTRYYRQHNPSEGHLGSVDNLLNQVKKGTLKTLPLVVAQLVDEGHDANVMINYLRNDFEKDLEVLKKHFRYILIDLAPLVFLDAIMAVEKSNQIICCCPEGQVKQRDLVALTDALVKAKDPEARILTLLTNSRMKLNHTGYYAYQAYMRKYSARRTAA